LPAAVIGRLDQPPGYPGPNGALLPELVPEGVLELDAALACGLDVVVFTGVEAVVEPLGGGV
jgi:hypothetical protein